LGRRWPNGWSALLVLLAAALMLTPAYPREGVETLAPALIVAIFQLATEGMVAAEHALRPLLFACIAALVLTLLLRVTLLRRGRRAASPATVDEPAPDSAAEQS
jgi:lipopolysaccharide export LptBFGC system permease protein LptF